MSYADQVCEKYREAVRQIKAGMAARGLSGSAWTYEQRRMLREMYGQLVLQHVDAEEDGESLLPIDAIQLDSVDLEIRKK